MLDLDSVHRCGNRAGNDFIIGWFLDGPTADPWVRRDMHEKDWRAFPPCMGGRQASRCTYLHGFSSTFMGTMKATFEDVAFRLEQG